MHHRDNNNYLLHTPTVMAFQEVSGVGNSEFALLDETMYGEIHPDLTNEILPILGRDKFTNITDDHYVALDPVLRLTSRMLLSLHATGFITTMTDGALHIIDGDGHLGAEIDPSELIGTGLEDVHLVRRRKSREPGVLLEFEAAAKRQLRSREILDNLVDAIDQIEIFDPYTNLNRVAVSTVAAPSQLLSNFPAAPKYMLKIELSYDESGNYQHEPDQPWVELNYFFVFARNLLHELGHVMDIVSNGGRGEAVFLHDECTNEAGFNLEKALFGGVYSVVNLGEYVQQPSPSNTTVATLRTSYPTREFIRTYEKPGESPILSRWPVERYYTVTRIPRSIICSMFTEHFWINEVPQMRSCSIRPSQLSRWIFIDVKAGETYVDDRGFEVIAKSDGGRLCSLRDPTLPDAVQEELLKISEDKLRNLRAANEARYGPLETDYLFLSSFLHQWNKTSRSQLYREVEGKTTKQKREGGRELAGPCGW